MVVNKIKRSSIGEFLKKKRLKRNMTQLQLSRKLGYSSSQFVSNWERGICSPPLDAIIKIGRLLGISEAVLMQLILTQTKDLLKEKFQKKKESNNLPYLRRLL